MDQFTKRIVSIIVVTAGRLDLLRPCLESLRQQGHRSLEIIVVNNALSDEIQHYLQSNCQEVKLFDNFKKPDYCHALNIGINKSQGEFVLCLNDDTVLEPDFITQALRGFAVSKQVGMVSGKIMRPDKRTIDSTGLFVSIWRTAKERGYGRKDKGQFQKEGFIFGVSGAAAFYRKEMLEAIKENGAYFDLRYKFYYEDLDLAWRADRLGWQGYYIPEAIVYHVRGSTARRSNGLDKPFARKYISDELYICLLKNRYWTVIKNESILSFLIHLPFILVHEIISWVYTLLYRPRTMRLFFSRKCV